MYPNAFASIWEYSVALRAGRIAFEGELGATCPVCGSACGYRSIGTYERTVIELLPFESGPVPIARFRCGQGQGTFSLLPHQLAPYHRYTIGSMTLAVLCLCRVLHAMQAQERSLDELPAESAVSVWHLRRFVEVLLRGFLRTHAQLGALFDLTGIEPLPSWRQDFRARALATGQYLAACAIRGPPDAPDMEDVLYRYSRQQADFLCGTPSQGRRDTSEPATTR